MNKIFKVIWCNVTQSWVAVSELQRAKGKVKAKIALLSTATLFINLLGGGSFSCKNRYD
ncbi:hypothetical protein CFY87_08920 [Actinobacillus seminis]|uniref:Autotransporter adhesin n=1 Tax=Actinobacillus seminis TaxID=722 RepID=A0A263HC25_9PAST|nr:ESPR domain-containing protein [Actinobacillus seminis]OZN24562.1 hypothetical protein CFY87_08920 [Actinobacillus seminis]SUU38668.1 autotransporter adhesin [Actinobacillus seminis]